MVYYWSNKRPAAPAGARNITFLTDGKKPETRSAYVGAATKDKPGVIQLEEAEDATKFLAGDGSWQTADTGGEGAPVELEIIDGSVATQANLGNIFYINADQDFVLENPTGVPGFGWQGLWIIRQTNGGGHVMTLGTMFRGGDEIPVANVVLSTENGSVSYLICRYFDPYGALDIVDFKTGYLEVIATYSIEITIPAGRVGTDLAAFPIYINLADMPAGFWAHLADPWGADIRVTDAADALLPIDLVWISKETQKGTLFIKTPLSTGADTVLTMHYGDPELQRLAVGDAIGRNAVWADYARVFMFGDSLYDRTGSGVRVQFPGTPNYPFTVGETSADTGCHQGVAWDGTHYYVTGTNTIKKYDASWALVATNSDPCGDAGAGVEHSGDPVVKDGILYVPQTSASGYTVTIVSEFNCADLSYIQSHNILPDGMSPGDCHWTASLARRPARARLLCRGRRLALAGAHPHGADGPPTPHHPTIPH